MGRIAGYWSPPPRALRSLPELTYVGSMSARSAVAIGAHRHQGWEICLIERGRTHWFIDGRSLEIRGGHLVVIPPHALHDGWQPGSYRFLGLRLPRAAVLLGLPRP
ncbi:MAG: AraC family ligand binding domain-containing protein, partial [Planctomycetes bacterium]|nr:AraC family ligand binding domain-containing protein [Planctomycetota bacterium]